MGHTRWATHGAPTDRNAHPHLDCTGRIAVIHNGIIENYQALRDRLEKAGHTLRLGHRHRVRRPPVRGAVRATGDLADAVRATVAELEGAYALVALSADEPERIVGAKVSSPLVVGLGDGETILASDIPAVLDRTRTVVPVEEGQVVERHARRRRVHRLRRQRRWTPEPITVDWDIARRAEGRLRRLHAEGDPRAARRDPRHARRPRRRDGRLALDELHDERRRPARGHKVFVVACGTAFHSGLVAKYAIEHWTRLPVEIEIASEFRYRDPVLGPTR